AIMSIGAVKGFEIGDGFEAAASLGSQDNDCFIIGKDGRPCKVTNHSGGTLGGMSDGSTLVMRAAFKPTPSISQIQKTVDRYGKEREIEIKGRHDPVIVPRAVVVVEAMAALTVADLLLMSMTSRLDKIKKFFKKEEI
ncbi:MAG: chorismate synthase, partial [Clostridium sp.]